MYSKEKLSYRFLFPLIILLLLTACSSKVSESLQVNGAPGNAENQSRLLVDGQLQAPNSIRSIQLYRDGDKGNPPFIRLNSNEKIKLEFDELTDLTGQFRINFYHYDPEWNQSNLPVDWYLSGLNEMIAGSGTPNKNSNPNYVHYEVTFPNRQVSFKVSGNYMAVVSDFSSGTPLFSMPFYVVENEGEMISEIETVFNAGENGAAIDQPFTEFYYPEFVIYPQFDLRYYFVQNRFWGDAKQTETFDINQEGRSRFYLKRDDSFPANFDFLGLNILELGITGPEILDWQPDLVPPLLILRDDFLNFSADPVPRWRSSFGNPSDGRESRYSNVRFRFNARGELNGQPEIYLLGDFNQWSFEERNRMIYDPQLGVWESTQLIKQGLYTYKYVLKEGNEINELRLGDSISRVRQEYTSFVYFLDPDLQYYRLLQTQIFYSD